ICEFSRVLFRALPLPLSPSLSLSLPLHFSPPLFGPALLSLCPSELLVIKTYQAAGLRSHCFFFYPESFAPYLSLSLFLALSLSLSHILHSSLTLSHSLFL